MLHFLTVALLSILMSGCSMFQDIHTSNYDHKAGYLTAQVATQTGLYLGMKHEKSENIERVMELVDYFDQALQEDGSIDWRVGEQAIIKHSPIHLQSLILPIYFLAEGEVNKMLDEGADLRTTAKYLNAAVYGAKEGLRSALIEAKAREA